MRLLNNTTDWRSDLDEDDANKSFLLWPLTTGLQHGEGVRIVAFDTGLFPIRLRPRSNSPKDAQVLPFATKTATSTPSAVLEPLGTLDI